MLDANPSYCTRSQAKRALAADFFAWPYAVLSMYFVLKRQLMVTNSYWSTRHLRVKQSLDLAIDSGLIRMLSKISRY